MAQPWSVPPLWSGETVVVAGNGPSLTLGQLEACRGQARIIAVNDAARLAPWADWLHGCDFKWWDWHKGWAPKFAGIRTTLSDMVPDPWARMLRNTGANGFDPDPANIRTGRNGVYQAIHCAVHAGAARILLLGVDMKPDARGRTHWFGAHPDGKPTDYASVMLPCFPTLIEPLRERGVEIINCTPGSALTCFPMARLEEALPCR